MSQPAPHSAADRNLLFGILAVQVNFIERDALVAAMHAWVLDKQKPLGQILFEQQKLTAGQLGAIDALIEQHLKMHGHDPELSLRASRATSTVTADLASIRDVEVQGSVAKLGLQANVDETLAYRRSPPDEERYQKLRHHADGGQGRVFVAGDAELHREVALKEIKPEYADHLDSRLRFVLEAEITGGLEHPGIVPVYGLGTYADGRPYYAMRFIRGDNLEEAIVRFHAADKPGRDEGERSLAFRQLLRRFVDVCNAVAYAHSRGVVHRDLKPKNVMLGKFGETLVVDWGLAKVGTKDRSSVNLPDVPTAEGTLRPPSGSSVEATMDGAQIGTPPFMSPEQAAGRVMELGPASDIYSLGSSLYVLLTGKKPFEASNKEAVLAQVRGGQFAPPKQVRPDTPAALNAICCKAMSLQPQDRYANALDLAAEIEHWLADEPVAAYPEPWLERGGRWARRHRAAVMSAGAVLLCVVIGLALSSALISAEQQRTAEQKRVAVENYRLARDQSFRIVDLIEQSEADIAAKPALHKTRKDILVLVATACQSYLEQEPEDRELRRKSAQVYRYAANVHRLTDEFDAADPLYGAAIEIYSDLAQQDPDDMRYRQLLAETLRDRAKLQSNRGRLKAATDTLARSLALIEELVAGHPDQAHLREALAATLVSLASTQYTRGTYQESRQTAHRAAEIYRELVALPNGQRHPYDPVLLAAALNIVAISERESGQYDAALEAHREPVKTLFELAKAPPEGVNSGDVSYFYAACQLEQFRTWARSPDPKRVENAEKGLGVAIATLAALAKNFPQVSVYREALGFAYQCRALVRAADLARHEEARGDLEESRKLLEQRVQESPDKPAPRGDLGRTYLAWGRLARQANDPTATEWLRKARESLEKAVAQSPDNAQDQNSLAEVKSEPAE